MMVADESLIVSVLAIFCYNIVVNETHTSDQ
jgi:hypothetical protein